MNVNLVGAPTFTIPGLVQHKAVTEPATPAAAADLVSLSGQGAPATPKGVTVPRALFTATCAGVGVYAGMTFLGPIGGAVGAYMGAKHGWSSGEAMSGKNAAIAAGLTAGGAALGYLIGGSTAAQGCGAILGFVIAESMQGHH